MQSLEMTYGDLETTSEFSTWNNFFLNKWGGEFPEVTATAGSCDGLPVRAAI